MKEKTYKLLALFLALIAMFSFEIFTVDVSAVSNQKEIVLLNSFDSDTEDLSRVTGLIRSYYIGLSRSGDKMYLGAKVYCTADVVKCGFKEIVVYRRVTGTTNWSVVTTINIKDEYVDQCTHMYTAEFSILPNFDYRATCVHYAKKNFLMTQTIDDYSNVI